MGSSRDDKKNKERRNLAKKWADEQDKSGSASCVQPPEGVDILKLKAGKEAIELDFFPFIAGDNNFRADAGEEAVEKTYELHWVPTLTNKNKPVACRAFCFGKPCAVCDWLRKNGGTADEKFVKAIRAKRRHLWLVTDKPGVKEPPLKLLDTSDKNQGKGFAELMSDAITALGDDKDPFALEGGCTAKILVREQTGGDFKYEAATRIDFKERDHDYPDDMLSSNPCLDECILDPGYDEVMELLEPSGRGKAKDEKEERPSRTAVSRTPPSKNGHNEDDDQDEDEDEDKETSSGDDEIEYGAGDEVEFENEHATIQKVLDNGKFNVVDDNDVVTKSVEASELKPWKGDEEEEEEEKPAPRKTSRK